VLLKKLALEENLVVKDLVVWENEGIKILLADSNDVGDISTKWITLRISGTEYKTRIMAEAAYDITNSKKSKEKEIDSTLEQYFDIGKEIIGRKGSSSAYKYIQGFITFLQKISKIDGTQIKDISVSSIISETYKALSRQVYLDIVNNIQRETYSFLFEKDTEYTIVAVNGDTKREAEARALAAAGIKVNLIYVGENNLTREINTRLEFRVDKKWLAYGLIDNSVKNLTVYGEDNSEQIGNKSFTQQQYLSAILNYINEKSTNTVKILDLPEELSDDINIEEIEEETSNNFTAIGVGKNVFKLFYDAMKNKNKQTSNNFIKLSLAAANVTSDQFSNFGKNDIDRLAQQGITDVILSPFENTDINNFDAMIRTKSNKIRDILFYAHAKGIKITLSFNLSLPENITGEETKKLFTVFVNNLGQRIPTFVDLQKRGLDGIQLDLSQNNVNILMPNMEPFYALAKTVNNTLPIGSFLAIKMPESLNPGSGYPMLFNYDNVKAVFDYNSPYIEEGISAFGQKGILVNISTDENNSISAEHLARLFENANKKTKENNNRDSISMLSIDSSILKQIDSSEFTFNRMTLINFINSIFGTTPEGQFIKGENKGRTFVSDRDLVFSDEIVKTLCEYVFSDKIDVKNLNEILGAKLKETTSQYELKGFVTGVIQKGEVDRIDSEISFDRTEYSYLLMRALYDYRTTKYEEIFIKNKNSDISEFEKDKDFARGINSYMDPKNVLSNHKFSENIQPEINEILEIFTGKKEGSVDILITRLSKLKDSSALKNNNVDKIAILEALLLLLLNDARLPETDISEKFKETINIKDMNTVMHAMLSAA
ncbi:MAG: hypothetical protein II816_00490, partial [Elusimicrobia bacterium]|nr:hypothetical protein [Elusimicrobiota bacterium]